MELRHFQAGEPQIHDLKKTNFQTHLHRGVEQCERCGPHKGRDLCGGGRDEHGGRLYVRMHARSLGLGGEDRLRRGQGEGVGGKDRFDLGDRCLYDVGEGLQLCQGIWQTPSKGGSVKRFNRTSRARVGHTSQRWKREY